MLYGFEEQTADLNTIEVNAAYEIARSLAGHIGKDNAVTGAYIGNAMAQYDVQYRDAKGKPYLTGARVRKIINYIRTTGMCPCLIASSSGYYVSKDQRELAEYVKSLRERAKAINAVADKLEYERMAV